MGYLEPIYIMAVHKPLWDALPLEVKYIFMEEVHLIEALDALRNWQISDEIYSAMLATGAKLTEPGIPDGFFDLMRKEVTIPLMAEELEKTGALGLELVTVIEEALEVKLH